MNSQFSAERPGQIFTMDRASGSHLEGNADERLLASYRKAGRFVVVGIEKRQFRQPEGIYEVLIQSIHMARRIEPSIHLDMASAMSAATDALKRSDDDREDAMSDEDDTLVGGPDVPARAIFAVLTPAGGYLLPDGSEQVHFGTVLYRDRSHVHEAAYA